VRLTHLIKIDWLTDWLFILSKQIIKLSTSVLTQAHSWTERTIAWDEVCALRPRRWSIASSMTRSCRPDHEQSGAASHQHRQYGPAVDTLVRDAPDFIVSSAGFRSGTYSMATGNAVSRIFDAVCRKIIASFYKVQYEHIQESLANAKVSARQPWHIGRNSLNPPPVWIA